MRRPPAAAVWPLAAAVLPLGVFGAVAWGAGEASPLVVLSVCARAWATAASLPVALALALATSISLLLVWTLGRHALTGMQATRRASRHQVEPPPFVQRAAHELGIRRLVVCDLPERLAFCAGLTRPVVVVSSGLVRSLSSAPLRAVLAHEAEHARRRDPLRQTLAHAVGRALWVAPAAREAAEHQRLRQELAADRFAGDRCGRRALAQALLALHTGPSTASRPAIAGAASLLAARIDALTSGSAEGAIRVSRAASRRSAIGLSVAALLVAAVLIGPTADAGANGAVPMPMSLFDTLDMATAWVLRAGVIGLGWVVLRRWQAGLIRD